MLTIDDSPPNTCPQTWARHAPFSSFDTERRLYEVENPKIESCQQNE